MDHPGNRNPVYHACNSEARWDNVRGLVCPSKAMRSTSGIPVYGRGAVIRPHGQARSFGACSGGGRMLRRIGYFGEKDRGSAPVKLIPCQNGRFRIPLTCKKASYIRQPIVAGAGTGLRDSHPVGARRRSACCETELGRLRRCGMGLQVLAVVFVGQAILGPTNASAQSTFWQHCRYCSGQVEQCDTRSDCAPYFSR